MKRDRSSPRGACTIREPFNGLSHLAGAVLSVVGLVVLLVSAHGQVRSMIGFGLYGVSLITLYVASALYHSLCVSRRAYDALGRFDYVAIFLLIAGTYAPLCLVTLRGVGGGPLLAAEYGLALAGSLAVLAWDRMPDWVRWALYLVMGWMLLGVLVSLRAALPPAALGWLLGGGGMYTVGAAVMALGQSRFWPARLRRGRDWSHGLWHLFVLGGSACHFVLIFCFVAPQSRP